MKQSNLLYVIPAEKAEPGMYATCLVLKKGETKPQKHYQKADTYMERLLHEPADVGQEEGHISYLYPQKDGGRGKVYFLSDGTILIPVKVQEGKGNIGYVSLKDMLGCSGSPKEHGTIHFKNTEVTLLARETTSTLMERMNRGLSMFCEGYRPSDLIWTVMDARDRVESQLAQPKELSNNPLCLGKSTLLTTVDFLKKVPQDELLRVLNDLSRNGVHLDIPLQKDRFQWMKAYLQVVTRGPVSDADVGKAIYLTKHPEQIKSDEELKERLTAKKIWPASYAGNEKPIGPIVVSTGRKSLQEQWDDLDEETKKKLMGDWEHTTEHLSQWASTMVEEMKENMQHYQPVFDAVREQLKQQDEKIRQVAQALQEFCKPMLATSAVVSQALQEYYKPVLAAPVLTQTLHDDPWGQSFTYFQPDVTESKLHRT